MRRGQARKTTWLAIESVTRRFSRSGRRLPIQLAEFAENANEPSTELVQRP